MSEFRGDNPGSLRQNRLRKTKKFTVKPAILFSENHSSDFLGRPLKLKTITIRKIAKYVMTDTQHFLQLYKHEEFLSVPPNLRLAHRGALLNAHSYYR